MTDLIRLHRTRHQASLRLFAYGFLFNFNQMADVCGLLSSCLLCRAELDTILASDKYQTMVATETKPLDNHGLEHVVGLTDLLHGGLTESSDLFIRRRIAQCGDCQQQLASYYRAVYEDAAGMKLAAFVVMSAMLTVIGFAVGITKVRKNKRPGRKARRTYLKSYFEEFLIATVSLTRY